MKKIIKEGTKQPVVRFICNDCSCIFNSDEYGYVEDENTRRIVDTCPNECPHTTSITKII